MMVQCMYYVLAHPVMGSIDKSIQFDTIVIVNTIRQTDIIGLSYYVCLRIYTRLGTL